MDPNVLAVLAQIGSADERHMVQLTLRNLTDETVLIDPYNLCGGSELSAPIFTIVDAGGHKVPYKGRMVKRGEPDFDRFIRLPPKADHVTSCSLDGSYRFEGREPPYRVQYSVYNMHPTEDYFQIRSQAITMAR